MPKKQKDKPTETVKFEKFLPGESVWLGRKNKSRQDQMQASRRERVADWQDRIDWMKEHRPVRSADYPVKKVTG